ncbi:MAG: hypothetical protein M5U28_44690 [Sandaracinaceae bacterium]|nr:hypothetical protein [Sandaracinaceae bacterium]
MVRGAPRPGGAHAGLLRRVPLRADQWRPGYPNPAFDRHTERDAAWMARILSRFTDEQLRALARQGRFEDPVVEQELASTLIGRRDRILERYLTRLSPLTAPEVRETGDGAEVCLHDLAVESGVRPRTGRRYGARAWAGEALAELERPRVRLDEGARVCVRLPARRGRDARGAALRGPRRPRADDGPRDDRARARAPLRARP